MYAFTETSPITGLKQGLAEKGQPAAPDRPEQESPGVTEPVSDEGDGRREPPPLRTCTDAQLCT